MRVLSFKLNSGVSHSNHLKGYPIYYRQIFKYYTQCLHQMQRGFRRPRDISIFKDMSSRSNVKPGKCQQTPSSCSTVGRNKTKLQTLVMYENQNATSESLSPNCSNYATLNHIRSTVHKCTITFY